MGSKVQPIGFRLGHSLNWKANWQAHTQEFGDKAFRDHQIETLLRDFLRQHGILMGTLSTQELILQDGKKHLLFNANYFVRRRTFLQAFKQKTKLKDIKQLKNPRKRWIKQKLFLQQAFNFRINEIIKVQAPILVANFLKEFQSNHQNSFELRLVDTFKIGKPHSLAIHKMQRTIRGRDRRFSRSPYGKDIYFLIHKMILTKDTAMVGNLIATLLEKTKKHHWVLNNIEGLVKIVYLQYQGLNGIRIQTKGRIAGSKRKRKRQFQIGALALQRIDLPVQYSCHKAVTRFGVTSIKIWLT